MNTLFIIRGVPGTGKTTLGYAITPSTFAADDYFTDEKGNYHFDPTKLEEAHEACFQCVKKSMFMRHEKIAVTNTFTRRWEYDKYIKLAERMGYRVMMIALKHKFGNVHGVPEEVVARMEKRFEE